jgi:hypothetical protein
MARPTSWLRGGDRIAAIVAAHRRLGAAADSLP